VKEEDANTVKRSAGGKFAAGVSGNPAGRPRGKRDARTLLLADLVDGGGAEVVGRLLASAKKGEPWAVRLVVERLLPKMERRLQIDLPRVELAADVAGAVANVIDLASTGELTVEEARGFLGLLEQQRKTIETADLAVRLELLEEAQGRE
jgi:hypothetical protein